MNQVFLEDGNLGLVLPKMLSDWTTEQVRNGEDRRFVSGVASLSRCVKWMCTMAVLSRCVQWVCQ